MEERKIQITDDNELQTAVYRMYHRCPTDYHNKDVYSPGKVLRLHVDYIQTRQLN